MDHKGLLLSSQKSNIGHPSIQTHYHTVTEYDHLLGNG
jgi:hypothetical protein